MTLIINKQPVCYDVHLVRTDGVSWKLFFWELSGLERAGDNVWGNYSGEYSEFSGNDMGPWLTHTQTGTQTAFEWLLSQLS